MVRVLFVCLGNICRSPMAEAIFRHLVEKEGLTGKIEVDSAGTGDWHIGKVPHEGTRGILDAYAISYEGMKARQVAAEDLHQFDYVITMDDQNAKNIQKLGEAGETTTVRKLMDFIEQPKSEIVPDPYFTGNFDETYELVTEGCTALLDHIKANHKLEE